MRDLILRHLDKLALLGAVLSVGAGPVLAAEPLRHHIIDAKAMKAAKFDSTTTYDIRPDGGLRNLGAVYACFNAGVHLPHDVRITRVIVAYASGASASDPVAAIIRNPLGGSEEPQAVAISALQSDSGTRKLFELPLTGPTLIDNARYSYGLSVCLDGPEKDAFYAVRITYTKLGLL